MSAAKDKSSGDPASRGRGGSKPGKPLPTDADLDTPQPAGAEPDVPQPADAEPPALQLGDVELAAIVRSVDQGESGPVTLTVLVAGSVISGDVIGATDWWKTMAQLARSHGGDVNQQFAEGCNAVSRLYDDANIMVGRPVGYLHLQNVPATGRPVGWRIRIEEVAAWRWGPVNM